MDVSHKIEQLVHENEQSEAKTKRDLEISEKKYHLQKDLRDLNLTLSVKQTELKKLKNEVVKLGVECIALERQAEIAKQGIVEVVKEIVVKENATEEIQEDYWGRLNDFIAKSNSYFEKHEPLLTEVENKKKLANVENKGKEKIRQLELEGHLEAAKIYGKFLARKVEEIKAMKQMLESLED